MLTGVVANSKPIQKAIKKDDLLAASIAKVLEIHSDSENVVLSAFATIAAVTVSGANGEHRCFANDRSRRAAF